MNSLHDKIFFRNKQRESYNSISVSYFNKKLDMHGSKKSIPDVIQESKFLRIADCSVKPEKIEHFEEVQRSVWIPGMQGSQGMLGGEFSKAENSKPRYLVSTFWDSEKNHSNYVDSSLPKLKLKSDVTNDINYIVSKQILLVDSWKIVK